MWKTQANDCVVVQYRIFCLFQQASLLLEIRIKIDQANQNLETVLSKFGNIPGIEPFTVYRLLNFKYVMSRSFLYFIICNQDIVDLYISILAQLSSFISSSTSSQYCKFVTVVYFQLLRVCSVTCQSITEQIRKF